jgi:hypothetical protein
MHHCMTSFFCLTVNQVAEPSYLVPAIEFERRQILRTVSAFFLTNRCPKQSKISFFRRGLVIACGLGKGVDGVRQWK